MYLNNGIAMPALGLGTFESEPGQTTYGAVSAALEVGYRLIDTAAFYANEASVGRAVTDSGLPRDEIFVTTKLWNDDHGRVRAAFEESLAALDLDYVDLYLIHWPMPGRWQKSWEILCELFEEGHCRAIGVSNFTVADLTDLLEYATVPPPPFTCAKRALSAEL